MQVLAPDLPITTSPFSQYAGVSGQVNIPRTNTGAVVVADNGDVSIPGGLSVDSNTLFVDEVNNRVGVASSSFSAASKLHVEGQTTISGSVWLDVNDDTLVVQDTTNRVGIGTETPSDKLHVVGAVRSTGLIVDGAVSGTGFSAWDQNASNDLTTSTIFVGDVTGDWNSTVVGNDSDSHADSTISDDITINNGLLFAPGSGNVGIGTTSPAAKLQIVGGQLQFESTGNLVRAIQNSYDIILDKDRDNSGGAAWFQFRTAGGTIVAVRIEEGDEADIRGDGSFISNGLDFAEAFKVLDGERDLEAGDVVSLAVGQWEYCRRTTDAYDAHVIGVVSESPGFVCGASFNAEDAVDPALTWLRDETLARGEEEAAKELTMQMSAKMKELHRAIALSGRVPCKVDGSFGPILAGDRVTSSPTPGHAMVQKQAGFSIGVALEDWTAPSKGEVIVLVQPGWHQPSSAGTAAQASATVEFEGTAVLGGDGATWVIVPEAVNVEYASCRYELTPVGRPASLYVREKLRGGQFQIAGGSEGMEVSWQVRCDGR